MPIGPGLVECQDRQVAIAALHLEQIGCRLDQGVEFIGR
jgi:hypothetical protein